MVRRIRCDYASNRKLDIPDLLILRYDLAFVRNDEAEMGRVAALAQETSRACRLGGFGTIDQSLSGRKAARDAALRRRLKELAAKRMRFGYRRLTAMLLREGMPANHKRVYRLYREEGLAMRIRARQWIRWCGPAPFPRRAGRTNAGR